MLYNTYMDNNYSPLRVWKSTAHKLKVLAALRGESMISLLDRLVTSEYIRLEIPIPEQQEEQDRG